jgi:hypothetical protein
MREGIVISLKNKAEAIWLTDDQARTENLVLRPAHYFII